MTPSQESPRRRRRWKFWLSISAVALLGGLAALVLALPWIIGRPWAQHQLTIQANRLLAPGGVKFDRLRVSWSRPTEIEGLVLRDPQGDDVVTSPRAHFSMSLWELLVTRPNTATLTLDQASVDIERGADGKVDLLETLEPILSDRPKNTLLIRIPDGKLRFRHEGLEPPIVADRAEIHLDLNAYPRPIAWDMKLTRTAGTAVEGTVKLEGRMSHDKSPGGAPLELDLSILGDRWPWQLSKDSIDAQGVFSGTLEVHEKEGNRSLAGDARILDLVATGTALTGDTLKLDTVSAAWKVDAAGEVWNADRLDLTSAVGTIKARGSFPPSAGKGAQLEGMLDLAALARQVPRTLRLRDGLRIEKGSVRLAAEITGDASGGGQAIRATAKLADLSASHGGQVLTFRDPATIEARLNRKADSLELEQLDVQTPFLTASGRGDLDKGIGVTATIDLKAGAERLREWVDLGDVELAGQGKVEARYRRIVNRFEASADAELRGLVLKGLPVVEEFRRDRLVGTASAGGGATPSGMPASLHDLSVSGEGDAESLKLTLALDQVTRITTIDANGRTRLTISGKKQDAAGSLRALWGEQDVVLDPISVALTPVVGPGGQFLPSDPARWSGKGRYDIGKDELTIATDPGTTAAMGTTLAISPTQVRAGKLRTPGAAWLEASLAGDVAKLIPEKPGQPRMAGTLDALVQARQARDGWDLGTSVRLHDLARVFPDDSRQVLADESSLSVRGIYAKQAGRLDLSELALVTPYGKVEGAGPIDGLPGTPRFDLKGTLSPDWQVLTDLLAKKVEPNASIMGTPRAWRLSGKVSGSGARDLLASLDGEFGVNLDEVDVFGMRLERAPVVLRARAGKLSIDPIDSTLNGGRLHLEPDIVEDKQGLSWLHMGPTSGLLDAVVNDEVSHRVLSFAAPVLDQATRVEGRISLALNEAYFPLAAGPDVQARIDGDVLFDSVQFMPGPLADQIISIFRQERRPLLVLRDPISVRILGRKVYQEGLIIPLGNVAVIGIEGWVDFDQNLDLVARFAMVPPRRNIPVLSQILENTELQVPIKGTFKNPKLNGDAIKDRFKDMGTNLLETMMDVGANGLNRILRGGLRRGQPVPPRDFFPPFNPPGEDIVIVPPRPRPDQGPAAPGSPAERNTVRVPRLEDPSTPKVGDDPDAQIDNPTDASDEMTARQRQQMQREERKQRRLDKRNERRLRRGLPPR